MLKGAIVAMFILGQLKSPYNELFQQKAWDRYVTALNKEGLRWWFNMDIPTLASHLIPLASVSRRVIVPLRLQFLSEAVNMMASLDILDNYYQWFMKDDDLEAAAAAAGAAVFSAFEMGIGFDRIVDWCDRIKYLLRHQDDLSVPAISGLWHFRGMIGACVESNTIPVIKATEQSLAWSRRTGANNLRAHAAIFHLFGCVGNAEFDKIESIIIDVKTLCNVANISYSAKAVLMAFVGVHQMAKGRVEQSAELLKRNLPAAGSNELPTHSKMQIHYHAALHAALISDINALNHLAGMIQDLSFPLDMPFHSSYLHYVLGIVFLNANQLDKALFHVQRARAKGKESKSPLCENHIAMLQGQVLSDRGDFEIAGRLLQTWQDIWKNNGHKLYMIASEMEIANMLLVRGQKDAAREKYENARKLWPLESPIYVHARSSDFVKKIESALFSAQEPLNIQISKNTPPVSIQTFGELKIKIEGHVIDDRQWEAPRLKNLLKALIVLGATDVSAERLIGLLWPDADHGPAGLKDSVRRLRRVRANSPPWISMQNRRVSLSPKLCKIDAIQFQEQLAFALSDSASVHNIREALDIYKDDFLKNDVNHAWIIQHRDNLKSAYEEGVLVLADLCRETDQMEIAVPYIKKAIAQSPHNAKLYAGLMVFHVREGAPSKAHQVYRWAGEVFYGTTGDEGREKLKQLADLLETGHG